jgi:hypothetical protein
VAHQANATTQAIVPGTAAGSRAARRAAGPDVPAAAGRKGFKAELDDVRERMRRLGLGYDEIAAEVGRRYRLRPRESYRLAWGWSLGHAAARFNALAQQKGTDPQARVSMTGPHLCEYERWPESGRKPSVYALLMLARMYETDVLCLLDLAYHESLGPRDRLTLIRPSQAAPAGPHAGEEMAAALWAGDPAASGQPAFAQGLSLSLPYVPGRLVIEISDPVADPGLVVREAGDAGQAGGHLALVRVLPGQGRQVAGGG